MEVAKSLVYGIIISPSSSPRDIARVVLALVQPPSAFEHEDDDGADDGGTNRTSSYIIRSWGERMDVDGDDEAAAEEDTDGDPEAAWADEDADVREAEEPGPGRRGEWE